MTHPKPPNNFSCEGDSPKNGVTFNGISVEEFIDTPDTIRGDEIEIWLGLFKYSYNRSNGEKEDIEQLLDLVVEERKYHRGLSTVVLCHHSRIPMVVAGVGGVAVGGVAGVVGGVVGALLLVKLLVLVRHQHKHQH